MLAIVSEPERVHSGREMGAVVRRLRRSARLSQQELADRANVARSAIQKLEEGRGTVTLETVFGILTALSTDLAVLSRSAAYQTLFGPGSEP
jgi:transcriptional regulator with XRE-family HTH domain